MSLNGLGLLGRVRIFSNFIHCEKIQSNPLIGVNHDDVPAIFKAFNSIVARNVLSDHLARSRKSLFLMQC